MGVLPPRAATARSLAHLSAPLRVRHLSGGWSSLAKRH